MPISLNIEGDVYNSINSFSIDSTKYYLHCYYTSRSGWQLDIYDGDNNPSSAETLNPLLCTGRMMPNSALTWKYSRTSGLFSGEIVCVDYEGTGVIPVTKDNFGDGRQYQLTYFTEDEIEEYFLSEWTTYRRT